MGGIGMVYRVVLFLLTMGGALRATDPCELTADVAETLKRCIPGIQVAPAVPNTPDPGRTYLDIRFPQATDHGSPAAGAFSQRLVLAHRGYDEPLVLQTSGYSIFRIAPAMLTRAFDSNQLQVEHRFFENSSPSPKDWSKLEIRQAAADFHAITVAFKRVYRKNWVGTGASKGGMTSIYHRRFYPADLDGTVADVAPLSFSTADDRYVRFVEEVGGAKFAACRAAMEALQAYLLRRREHFQSTLTGTFTLLGGKDLAFEHAVLEFPFFFWQYHQPNDDATGCHRIPGENSPDKDVLEFLAKINPLDENYGDAGMLRFLPYYFQAATELGSPALKRPHLEGLLKHPFSIDQYAPKGVEYEYSNTAMLDVAAWVERHGRGMMLIYGEYDPWTAGAFPKACGDDCLWATVTEGNHRANLFQLPLAEKSKALARVSRWLGKAPIPPPNAQEQSLEDTEREIRSRLRL